MNECLSGAGIAVLGSQVFNLEAFVHKFWFVYVCICVCMCASMRTHVCACACVFESIK